MHIYLAVAALHSNLAKVLEINILQYVATPFRCVGSLLINLLQIFCQLRNFENQYLAKN